MNQTTVEHILITWTNLVGTGILVLSLVGRGVWKIGRK